MRLDLLRRFADAILDGDYLGATEVCAPPVPLRRDGRTLLFESRAALAADLAGFWPCYHAAGVRAIGVRLAGAGHGAATGTEVEWTFWTGHGRVYCVLRSTYDFRETAHGLRIVGIVSHNEWLERPRCA